MPPRRQREKEQYVYFTITIIDKDGNEQVKQEYTSTTDKELQEYVAKRYIQWARGVGYLDDDAEVKFVIDRAGHKIKIYVPGGPGAPLEGGRRLKNRRNNRKTKKSASRKARKTRRARA